MSWNVQALRARSRLLSLDFNRDARFRWCRPLDVEPSILETVSRYACSEAPRSPESMIFRSFLIDERNAERWLTLCSRCLAFCRARFLAWGELAKGSSSKGRSIYRETEYPRFQGICQARNLLLPLVSGCHPR